MTTNHEDTPSRPRGKGGDSQDQVLPYLCQSFWPRSHGSVIGTLPLILITIAFRTCGPPYPEGEAKVSRIC